VLDADSVHRVDRMSARVARTQKWLLSAVSSDPLTMALLYR
jgi:hypothetical protein